MSSDFFSSAGGGARNFMRWCARPVAVALDFFCDALLFFSRLRRTLVDSAESIPRQKVLIVGVEVPARGEALSKITTQLAKSRHDVEISTIRMKPQGKFANVDEAITSAKHELSYYDWLVIVDDDVSLPKNFLDLYIGACHLLELEISQPAYKFLSYASFEISRRRLGKLVRRVNFVEIGPLTVLHNTVFSRLVPFPQTRWAWGVDVLWSEIAKANRWRMAILDILPIRHLKPVAASYDTSAAILEANELLVRTNVTVSRSELLFYQQELVTRKAKP